MHFIKIIAKSGCDDVHKLCEQLLEKDGKQVYKIACVALDDISGKDGNQWTENDATWCNVETALKLTQTGSRINTRSPGAETQSPCCMKGVANRLHTLADSLPAAGCLLDVVLWPADNSQQRADYILYLGALRRLKDWHNANITIVDASPTAEVGFLQKFLSAAIHTTVDGFMEQWSFDLSLLWRGKMAVCDKIENKGLTMPGVCLSRLTSETPGLKYPRISLNEKHEKRSTKTAVEKISERDAAARKSCGSGNDQVSEEARVGRVLEVLDEIHLSTFPTILNTGAVYKLCQYQRHAHSQVMMGYVRQSHNTGLLARLPVYPDCDDLPRCAGVDLSTDKWKESIMADVHFAQEPEECLQDGYEFQYFLIISPESSSLLAEDNLMGVAYLLTHPYHINPGLSLSLYRQALINRHGGGGEGEEFEFNDLLMMSEGALRELLADMTEQERQKIQSLVEKKHKSGESTVIAEPELSTLLKEARLSCVDKFRKKQPQRTVPDRTLKFTAQGRSTDTATSAEFDIDLELWPETLIQQYHESQKRSLSRIQSTESMPMSSPVQPFETSTTVDMGSLLTLFQSDGTAARENLSPVRRRQPGRSQHLTARASSISHGLCDTTESSALSPSKLAWPECKTVSSHGIFYNTSRKAERVNSHLTKTQEKYVMDETVSSCRSPVVLFPKPHKRKACPHPEELRRSPRKKVTPSLHGGKSSGGSASQPWQQTAKKRSSRCSDHGVSPSSRRLSSSQSITPSDRSHSYEYVGKQRDHRRSDSMDAYTGIPGSNLGGGRTSTPISRESDRRDSLTCGNSGVEKLCQKDADGSFTMPHGEAVKKESRSERHKRKLQEIVDAVLLNHGLPNTDPIFPSCSARLFKVTKLYVMDLPTSRNLRAEMKRIAENQVAQVIEVDRNRQASQDRKKRKKPEECHGRAKI